MANLQRESNDGFLLAASVQDASGKDVDLSTYKGKLLLIVNIASQWYEMLVAEFLLLVVAEFLLSSREDDTRSWGNFLVYFSHNAMPT